MREYIDYNDTLREGTDKLNQAIDRAYDADETAAQAKQDVDDTLVTVNDTLDDVNAVKDTAITLLDEVNTTNQQVITLADDVQDAVDAVEQLKHVGEYNAGTTYVKNNVVTYNGSSYFAKQETTGNVPTNATYWGLLAQRGVDGEGAVASVNGVFPDLDGNVEIDIPDISGLATKAEVQAVEGELVAHKAEDASLTKKGHVQLSNATNSTSDLLAATPSAVKVAMDRANEAFQLGNSTKKELVDMLLLLDPSLPISYSSTWSEILVATGQISTGKKFASGQTTSGPTNGPLVIDGLDFAPKVFGAKPFNDNTGNSNLTVAVDKTLMGSGSSGSINVTIFSGTQAYGGRVTFGADGLTVITDIPNTLFNWYASE